MVVAFSTHQFRILPFNGRDLNTRDEFFVVVHVPPDSFFLLISDIERLYGDLDNEDSISVNRSDFWVLFVLWVFIFWIGTGGLQGGEDRLRRRSWWCRNRVQISDDNLTERFNCLIRILLAVGAIAGGLSIFKEFVGVFFDENRIYLAILGKLTDLGLAFGLVFAFACHSSRIVAAAKGGLRCTLHFSSNNNYGLKQKEALLALAPSLHSSF